MHYKTRFQSRSVVQGKNKSKEKENPPKYQPLKAAKLLVRLLLDLNINYGNFHVK